MARYALWVHAIDTEGVTRKETVVKFWAYEDRDEAERELVQAAEEEALQPGIAQVYYRIRHEDEADPFTWGTLFSDNLRGKDKENANV